MSIATDSVGVLTPPLTRNCIRQALARFRLPRYSALAERLHEYDVYALARRLWREIFPDKPVPQGRGSDVEWDFLHEITSECFPLDEDMINGYYQCDEHPLHGMGIDAETYGIPWEMGHEYYGAAPVLPLLYIVCGALEPSPWQNCDNAELAASEWMLDHGYWYPDDLEWIHDHTAVEEKLAALPAPFNGLAVVHKCLRRNTGNIFLDVVDGATRWEYEEYEPLLCEWSAAHVHELTRQWDEVEEEVEAMYEYFRWYSRQGPGRDDEVLEALAGVFDLQRDDDGGMDDD